MIYKITFFDGLRMTAITHDEMIATVKKGLAPWKQRGDRISWFKDNNAGEFTSAQVVNELGESTDASATITTA